MQMCKWKPQTPKLLKIVVGWWSLGFHCDEIEFFGVLKISSHLKAAMKEQLNKKSKKGENRRIANTTE